MKLSVGIITFNEEKILGQTLESVKSIADEIVVVDSFSTDKTVEIAGGYDAKVFNEEWKGFGPQKNSVINKCTGEWILLIDADEVLSEELVDAIREILAGKNEHDVYEINRCSVCFGKEIKHGGWSGQYATRLFKNGAVIVSDSLVHEEFITENKKGKLKEKIFHHTYITLEDYFKRFNRYTTLGALEYHRRGKKASWANIVFNPIYKFFRMYFLRLGFLDGIEGLLLAVVSANYSMVKYFKLREIWKNNSYISD